MLPQVQGGGKAGAQSKQGPKAYPKGPPAAPAWTKPTPVPRSKAAAPKGAKPSPLNCDDLQPLDFADIQRMFQDDDVPHIDTVSRLYFKLCASSRARRGGGQGGAVGGRGCKIARVGVRA